MVNGEIDFEGHDPIVKVFGHSIKFRRFWDNIDLFIGRLWVWWRGRSRQGIGSRHIVRIEKGGNKGVFCAVVSEQSSVATNNVTALFYPGVIEA